MILHFVTTYPQQRRVTSIVSNTRITIPKIETSSRNSDLDRARLLVKQWRGSVNFFSPSPFLPPCHCRVRQEESSHRVAVTRPYQRADSEHGIGGWHAVETRTVSAGETQGEGGHEKGRGGAEGETEAEGTGGGRLARGGGRAAKRTFNKRCAEIAPLPRPALFTGARQLSGRVPPQSPRYTYVDVYCMRVYCAHARACVRMRACV